MDSLHLNLNSNEKDPCPYFLVKIWLAKTQNTEKPKPPNQIQTNIQNNLTLKPPSFHIFPLQSGYGVKECWTRRQWFS